MSINKLNGIPQSVYSEIQDIKTVSNPIFETSLFDKNLDTEFNFDTFETSSYVEKEAQSGDALRDELKNTKEEQGLIGKLWDGFKNLTHIGAGSNKAEDKIKQYENGEISFEEAKEAIDKYKKGQEMCTDVVADIASGIVAVGAFALAVPTGGASLAAGLGLATAVGAGVKIGVKAGDAMVGGREYTGKDLLHDAATGAINGVMAPVTNGIGASVTKTIGKKLGLTVIKEGGEEIIEQAAKQGIKQGIKSIITQEGVEVVGGTLAKRALATGAGMAVDGAIGGAADNMVRAALDGENVLEAGMQGAIGGLIMAPVIGGGFKLAGKAGRALNNKIATKSVFKEGMETTFKQGQTGDCALLSMLDGMMKNADTRDKIKDSITKSAFGDYHVNIGGKSITVPKSALTDEMLADKSGIKLFEAAFKQLDDIDGGFAENIAKQFGLNPVHIASESITDETLDKIAHEGGSVLSLGSLIDNPDGTTSRHYFSIRNVDSASKTVTVVDPYDTAKLIDLSYDDVKRLGLSIDGGSIRETSLPTSIRANGEAEFFGTQIVSTSSNLDSINDTLQMSNSQLKKLKHFLKTSEVGTERVQGNFTIKKVGEDSYEILSKVVTEDLVSPQEMLGYIARNVRNADLADNIETIYLAGEIDSTQLKVIYDAVKRSEGTFESKGLSDALFDYKTKKYRAFNRILRGESIDDIIDPNVPKSQYVGRVKSEIKYLSNFLDSFEYSDPMRLYRTDDYGVLEKIILQNDGCDGKSLIALLREIQEGSSDMSIEELNKILRGAQVKQQGFLSTSITPEASTTCGREARDITWHLTTRGKVKGTYIDAYTDTWSKEMEFLLQKNTGLTINNIELVNGKWVITADVSQL